MTPSTLLDSNMNTEEWLSAFDTFDRPTAELLLASIQLVRRTEFATWTQEAILKIAEESSDPIAVFAVREVPTDFGLFPDEEGVRPEAASGSDVGSEGMVAHLLKSMERQDKRVLNHPSINTIRSRKVSSFVLVDDIVGTGRTITSFLAAIYSNRTIRSWVSRKLIKFHVVAYAQTRAGTEFVTSRCGNQKHRTSALIEIGNEKKSLTRHDPRRYPPDEIVTHRAVDGTELTATGPRNRLARIRKLSDEYGRRWGIPRNWRFGYQESMTLIAFEHGCPNNVPGLIWYDSKHGPKPLIPGRLPCIGSTYAFDDEPAREDIQQEGYILDCLLRGVKHASAISRRTGLPSKLVHLAIGRLRMKGLVDTSRRALPRGVREPRILPGCITTGSVPYLPRRPKGPDDNR